MDVIIQRIETLRMKLDKHQKDDLKEYRRSYVGQQLQDLAEEAVSQLHSVQCILSRLHLVVKKLKNVVDGISLSD